jgi:hypothetical protein
MVATNPCYQYIAKPHISPPSCFKKMRNSTTPRLPDGVPSRKRMDYIDSINSHPHQGVYYDIIQYIQRGYE